MNSDILKNLVSCRHLHVYTISKTINQMIVYVYPFTKYGQAYNLEIIYVNLYGIFHTSVRIH